MEEQTTQPKGKAIIYLRTSTKEQNPELQRQQCLDFCKSKNLEVIDIVPEQQSAYKIKTRPAWERVLAIAKKDKISICIWRYDRCFRNMASFVSFMSSMYEYHNIKVYSVQEEWVNILWEISESLDISKIPEPYNEMIKEQMKLQWKNQIRLVGKFAEDESQKRSARVSLAVNLICPACKEKNKNTAINCYKCSADLSNVKAVSYKGKNWGRKAKHVNQDYIIELKKQNPNLTLIELADKYNSDGRFKAKITSQTVFNILRKNNVPTARAKA
jgi:hypothetical protein